jgi:hypothetical protein
VQVFNDRISGMRIVTVTFDYSGTMYTGLYKAFYASVYMNSEIPIETVRVDPGKGSRKTKHANTVKLDVWNDFVQDADEDIILMDCDLLLMSDISDGFDSVSDVGITTRDYGKGFPLNGGVVFVRNTKKSRKFFAEWLKINNWMYDNRAVHKQYKSMYAGMNQAALGYMLNSGWKPETLPMSKYNLCEGWQDWQNARVIHIKGKLRSNLKSNGEIQQVWKYYRKLYETIH